MDSYTTSSLQREMSAPTFDKVQSAPRIVLMGSRRSGKTSMERVVFGRMSPHETLFVQASATPTLRLVSSSDLVRFAIFDIPGTCDLTSDGDGNRSTPRGRDDNAAHHLTARSVFSRCVALVYVIDAEAEPYAECARFAEVVAAAKKVNPHLALEVFVHKVDGDLFLTEEQKLDCRREIEGLVRAELNDLSIGRPFPPSSHNNSTNYALATNDADSESATTTNRGTNTGTNRTRTPSSKEEKVLPPHLDQVLEKMASFDVSFRLTSIYDHSVFEAFSKVISKRLVPQRAALEKMLDALVAACDMEKSFLFDTASKVYVATDSAPVDSASYELCADAIDVVVDVGAIYNQTFLNVDQSPSSSHEAPGNNSRSHSVDVESSRVYPVSFRSDGAVENTNGDPIALSGRSSRKSEHRHDTSSASVALSNGMSLIFDEVDDSLAVVCLIRTDNLDKRGLIDYNLACFRTAVRKLATAIQDTNNNH